MVSLGGTRPLWLGAGLTLLTVTFLWLEKLPLRPGLGVAALIGLALAGSLPLAAAADRGEPWFDYQAFAEGLGPKDPVSFDWGHGDYGPITWSRNGAEVVRVRAARPAYWKVRTLDEFDGTAGTAAGSTATATTRRSTCRQLGDAGPLRDRIQVSVQRLRGSDVVGAGTTLNVDNRPGRSSTASAREWESAGDLRNGDSYRADVYVPRPTAQQLAAVPAAPSTEQSRRPAAARPPRPRRAAALRRAAQHDRQQPAAERDDRFPPFGRVGVGPVAEYRDYAVSGDGDSALRASQLSRAWALSKRLRAATTTPYEYVLAVSDYLRRGFTYTEKPPAPAAGVHPLESFLFDTKAGYCQHFSAATALLLRMGGIPARVATGFSPGGYSKRRGAWIVRDTDAHSWVEVWFDGLGWVTVDTTPSATRRARRSPRWPRPASPTPRRPPPTPRPPTMAGPATRTRAPPARARSSSTACAAAPAPPTRSSATRHPAAASRCGPWPRSRCCCARAPGCCSCGAGGGCPTIRSSGRSYELETALRRSGRPTPAGMTLRQLEGRLGLSGEAAAYLRAVSAGALRVRVRGPDRAQRRALRRELASGLGLAGRLRTFWALPPRALAPPPTARAGAPPRRGR